MNIMSMQRLIVLRAWTTNPRILAGGTGNNNLDGRKEDSEVLAHLAGADHENNELEESSDAEELLLLLPQSRSDPNILCK